MGIRRMLFIISFIPKVMEDGALLVLAEKEEAEMVLMDLMEQWEAAQE